MLQPVEAQRVAARGDDAVERRLAAHESAIGQIRLGRDLFVEPQAGARRVRLGLDVDFRDAEGDEALQLIDALGDRWRFGQYEASLKNRECVLELVVPVVIAADDEQRVGALDRVDGFDIGVVGGGHRVVVAGRRQVLRQPQPDQPVIGAVGDRPRQILDRLGMALRPVFGIGVVAQPRDQRRLPLVRRNVANEFLAVIDPGLGQLLRLIVLCGGGRSEQKQQQNRKCARHRSPLR